MLWCLLSWAKDAVFSIAVLLVVSVTAREGLAGLARRLLAALRLLPGVEWLIRRVVRREVRGFLRQLEREKDRGEREGGRKKTLQIPEKGWRSLQIKWAGLVCQNNDVIHLAFLQ